MRQDEIHVTITVQYGDRSITTAKEGHSGNPLYAPREVREAGMEAFKEALDMLRAVTGDIDAPKPTAP